MTATGAASLPGAASTDADAKAFAQKLDAWNTVVLGGRPLPGLCEVSGDGVEHAIDVKKVPGKKKITITDLGRDVGKYTIKIVIWTQTQWQDAQGLRDFLQPLSNGGDLQALDVQHVALNWLGVKSLFINKVGVPHLGSRPGTVEIDLHALEYVAPSNAGTGSGTTIVGSKIISAKYDPNAANFTTAAGGEVQIPRPSSSTPATPTAVNPTNFTPANFTPGP